MGGLMTHALPSEDELQTFSSDTQYMIQNPHDEAFSRTLKYRINSYSLVCRLLPEVLARIFAHLTDAWTGQKRDIVTVTHVCRHWREVALAFPHLWSTLVYDEEERSSTELFWLMYERAKGATLTVSVHLRDDSDLDERKLEIAEHLLGQLYRTRGLSLTLPLWKLFVRAQQSMDSIFEALGTGSSCVKHFCLSSPQDTLDLAPFPIPVNLFDHHAPELHSLSLSRCTLPWNSPVFRGLTNLDLDNMSNFSPAADELWDILRGSPALERIRLFELCDNMENVVPPSSWNLDADAIIHLPRIHHFTLYNSSFAAYAQIFSRISIPQDAHIDVVVRVSDLGLRQIAVLPLLSPAFLSFKRTAANEEPEFIAISITIELKNPFSIYIENPYFRTEVNLGRCPDVACGQHLNAFFFSGDESTHINPFSSFRSKTPFVNIRMLYITQHRDFRHGIPWNDLFVALPGLRVLDVHVEEESLSELIEALMPTEKRATPIPELASLGINSLSELQQPFRHAERLVEVLEQRGQAGTRLDILAGSWFPESDSVINRLEQAVGVIRSD